MKLAHKDRPLFLYGHSLGGLVTIKLLIDRPDINVAGCIITSPLLGLGKNMHMNWLKKKFIHHLGDHLQDFIVNSRVNPTALTKRTKFLHTIFDDRLMIPFMSVKMAKYIFESVDFVKEKAGDFRFPIIIFHGKIDTVTNPEDSKNFIFSHVRPYREFYEFPQGYHEMQHDNEREELLERSMQFINKLPNLKNFGLMTTRHIPKPKPNNRIVLKVILVLIAILGLLARKYRAKLFQK